MGLDVGRAVASWLPESAPLTACMWYLVSAHSAQMPGDARRSRCRCRHGDFLALVTAFALVDLVAALGSYEPVSAVVERPRIAATGLHGSRSFPVGHAAHRVSRVLSAVGASDSLGCGWTCYPKCIRSRSPKQQPLVELLLPDPDGAAREPDRRQVTTTYPPDRSRSTSSRSVTTRAVSRCPIMPRRRVVVVDEPQSWGSVPTRRPAARSEREHLPSGPGPSPPSTQQQRGVWCPSGSAGPRCPCEAPGRRASCAFGAPSGYRGHWGALGAPTFGHLRGTRHPPFSFSAPL